MTPPKKKYTTGFDLSYWDLFVKFSEKHKKHGDKFSIINKQIYPNIRITLYLIQLLTPRTIYTLPMNYEIHTTTQLFSKLF